MCTSAKLTLVFMLIGLHGHSSEKVPKEELGEYYFYSLFGVFLVVTSPHPRLELLMEDLGTLVLS